MRRNDSLDTSSMKLRKNRVESVKCTIIVLANYFLVHWDIVRVRGLGTAV